MVPSSRRSCLTLEGRQPYGWIVTVLLGIAGALIGYWAWGLLGGTHTFGLDWIRWVISVAGAAILSLFYSAITRKGKTDSTPRTGGGIPQPR
ncbi:MAG: GlsB/YeaQ/YmgE family stress response rane protein [Propionibacteriaceae bacterium]|nr:GlsB/YeaQ/YmgE family stress response rane protein [Propionibacteriaceae bacterium]